MRDAQWLPSMSKSAPIVISATKYSRVYLLKLAVITDYRVRSMLHGSSALEEVVIVKRNMEENIEQNLRQSCGTSS